MVANPKQFGQGEAGEHGVGGVFQNLVAPHLGVDEVHLSLAALVAPDEGGADDLADGVQNHQAVHLAVAVDTLCEIFQRCALFSV